MPSRAPSLAEAVLRRPLLATPPAPSSPRAAAAAAEEPSTLSRLVDQVEDFVVDSGPSMRWLTGALGASMLAGGMAYSVQQGGNAVERGFANSVAVTGAGLYFSGVRDLLMEAQTCSNAAAVAGGSLAAAAAAAILVGSLLLSSATQAAQASGLIVAATGVHGTATKLTDNFVLAHQKLGHSAPDAAYTRRPYLHVMIGVACVAFAAMVALGSTFAAGKLGVTSAMVAASAAAFSACLDTCRDMSWQLWDDFRIAREQRAQARLSAGRAAQAAADLPA